jgi:hypothetical protein
MKRRDLISAVLGLPAMAGMKVTPLPPDVSLDAELPAAGATKGEEPPFVIFLQPDRALSPESAVRLREQMTEFLKSAGVNAKAAVLPHGMKVTTMTPSGEIRGGEPETPRSNDRERPWMGDVLFHFCAVSQQLLRVAIDAWDLHPCSVRHAMVTLTGAEKSRLTFNFSLVSPEFSSTHLIAIDERTNSLCQWGSVEAIGEHNDARERRDREAAYAAFNESKKEYAK